MKVKRFSHKDYTILHDGKDKIKREKCRFLFFICKKWNFEWGGNKIITGKINYVITPLENSLLITKERKNFNSFIQYVNHKARKQNFIVLEGEITK